MAYTLTTAIAELKRSMFWNERAVVREPIEGLVDSSNKVFYTAQKPIATTGITVYDSNDAEVSSGSYTIDSYEFGTLRFLYTAPSAIHYISYTAQGLTDSVLTDIVKNGFDKMEVAYPRSWFITTDSISSSATLVVDPVIGTSTFSALRLQVKLYLLCCEYELVYALMKYAAANYFKYRESRVSGVQVDRTKNADQLMGILDVLQKGIDDAVEVAANQAGDTPWGEYIPGSHSDVWVDQYDWFTDSKQDLGQIS